MIDRRHDDARARTASGRFVFLGVLLALGAAGCASGGPGPEGPPAPAFPDPVLEHGSIAPAAEARAAALVLRAEEALAAGDPADAAAAAREVVDDHPTAPVSGRALWLLARATRATGALREADAHAQRYARLLAPGDPRGVDVRLLQGSALVAAEEGEAALRRLLALPGDTPDAAWRDAVGLARSAASMLDAGTLATLTGEVPTAHPFLPVLLSARARLLYNAGAEDEARAAAQAALGAGAEPPEAAVAQGVLDGAVDASLGLTGPRAVVGGLLPAGGSPALREFAALVEEGVRAAVAARPLPGLLELEIADGGGTPEGSAAAVQALGAAGALAVVGPLQPVALDAAARARATPVPMVSPTSPSVPAGAPWVYTLLGPDPGAARTLARWAADAGLADAVLVHSLDPNSEVEAGAFAESFRAAGGTVLQRFSYAPGSTDFAEIMATTAGLVPDALVLTVPAEDVEVLAPQVTFFGLDTLGIHVLGTGGWTDEQVLRSVRHRHLDGVVVASPDRPSATGAEGYRRFVQAYERTHRKSLRSPVPALGYDAAALLLEALATGARTPDALGRALESIRDFEGATGVLSVEDGRIVRRHQVVCLQGGALLPAPSGARPLVVDRRPPPDTLGGIRPVPVGLPFVRVCPGEPAPEDGVPVGVRPVPEPPGRTRPRP